MSDWLGLFVCFCLSFAWMVGIAALFVTGHWYLAIPAFGAFVATVAKVLNP